MDVLTFGNIKRKSKILYYYLYSNDSPEYFYNNIRTTYDNNLKQQPEFEDFRAIDAYLHDAQIDKIERSDDLILDLTLLNQEDQESKIKLIFRKGKIVSQNSVLKSGKISRVNKKIIPKTYLYDEIYSEDGKNYITIVFTSRNKLACYAFPLITIQFDSIAVNPKELKFC